MKFSVAFLCELLILLIPIPASILLNRYLGPDDRGILANLMFMPAVVATILSCNWEQTLRGYLIRQLDSLQNILNITFTFFIIQAVIGILFCVVYNFIYRSSFTNFEILSYVAVAVIIPSQLASGYLISICTCIVPAKNLYYLKILGSTSFLVSTLFIIYLEKFDITSAFISNQIIPVILILGGLYLIVKIKNFYLDGNSLKTYYKNLIKPTPSHILGTVSTQLDIWLLLNFASFGATGAYLTFRILELPFKGLLFSPINISTTKYDWTNQKLVSNFTNKSIFIFILLLTIALFFQDLIYYIIYLLIGNDYSEYFWMIKYVLYVSCLSTCLIISMNSLLLSGMISKYYNIRLIVSFIKIILLLILFKILGIKGIFLALIITNTLGILLVLILINNLNFKIFKL